ncbi:MAG: Flp pilus assembly protein CpaB [Rubellimicrobium sp.]|nr:Flp pilus assembly protein CpaB [Rubellimicrobium sp.]
MRAVFGVVLIVGLGLAGFAVYMVQGYFQQQEQQLQQAAAAMQQQVPTVDVLAVNRVVQYGEQIRPEDVIVIRYAEPFLPEGVFRTGDELFPQGREVLRSALRQMEPNEPILAVKVTEPGVPAGIATRLTAGMRAFTISVDATSSVSGFLRPGDRVDVYWTGMVDQGTGQEVTKLIETGVEIIAIDQTADANLTEVSVARTATVQVTPQQVANLALAQATGALSISLVGQADTIVAEVIEVNQRTLLGLAEPGPVLEPPPPPPPAPEVCTIRTRRGAEVVEIPIPCSN